MDRKLLLVTGANGQVASEYQRSQLKEGWDCVFLTKDELNIADMSNVRSIFSSVLPNACLNLAAFTNVEKAETDAKEKAYDVNVTGPSNLAVMCKEMNIPLIHVSTDYVFDGTKMLPYVETDEPNPLNNYGMTKLMGEREIEKISDHYFIIRVSWVYSNLTKNFYTTMLMLAQQRSEVTVVADQVGSPTSSKEVCRAVDAVLGCIDDKSLSGVYHFSGRGIASWKEFAEEIYRAGRVAMKVNGTISSAWPSNVTRPTYSAMSSKKFVDTFGYIPLHWKNALKEMISERRIMPIKVGDMVMIGEHNHVVVTTDWSRKVARLSQIDNMKESFEVSFHHLHITEE